MTVQTNNLENACYPAAYVPDGHAVAFYGPAAAGTCTVLHAAAAAAGGKTFATDDTMRRQCRIGPRGGSNCTFFILICFS